MIVHLKPFIDERGYTIALETNKDIPFDVKRVYYLYNATKPRGNNAHKTLKQFLICLNGICRVTLDNGFTRDDFFLDSPDIGLYIKPNTWSILNFYTNNTILLVMASEYYDKSDYIFDYDEFIRSVQCTT